MKFFFNGGGYTELVATLRKRGHEVVQHKVPWLNYVRDKKSCYTYNKKIIRDAIIQFKPDIYVCSKGFKTRFKIYPETTRWIKKHVGITVYWSQDDPFFIPAFLSNHLYHGYDLALSCSTEGFSVYRRVGIRPYLFWPAWDSMERTYKVYDEKDKVDLIFVGTPYACTDIPRKELMLWAVKSGLSVEIYGSKAWVNDRIIRSGRIGNFIQGDRRLRPYYKGEWKNWRKLHHLFSRSRMNISNHIVKARMYLNDRVSMVMGAGGCLVMDRNPGMGKIFKHNKEIVFYENFATFQHRFMYYLTHPKMREAIGKAARKKTLQEHTYARRAHQLLNILNKNGYR